MNKNNQVHKSVQTKRAYRLSVTAMCLLIFTSCSPYSGINTAPYAEIAYWNSIRDSQNPTYYQAYLKRYGENGTYSEIAAIKLHELKAEQSKVHLTVRTRPEGARVRILNIVPKYHDYIELKPGRYQIEVTYAGYQRYLEWIELRHENTVHSVMLALDENGQPPELKPMSAVSPSPSQAANSVTDHVTDMQFIQVKSGCFRMGSNDDERDEKPVHRVCLSQDFDLGKYEVTQAQWQQVMGNNPSNFKGSSLPVEKVSWNDVQKFIRRLNRKTKRHYRLPTEAEWEYACRSGGKDQNNCGSNNIDSVAWIYHNSGGKTHPVGQKDPNRLGLYDMSGNVSEWVQNWYNADYYSTTPTNNPKGPSVGSHRVRRGGSWFSSPRDSRAAGRDGDDSGDSGSGLGFRLARTR